MHRALISVSDKRGIVEFARGLVGLGWEIVSTGGTATSLKKNPDHWGRGTKHIFGRWQSRRNRYLMVRCLRRSSGFSFK